MYFENFTNFDFYKNLLTYLEYAGDIVNPIIKKKVQRLDVVVRCQWI